MSRDALRNCFYKGTMLAAAAVGVLVTRGGYPPPQQQLQIPSRRGTTRPRSSTRMGAIIGKLQTVTAAETGFEVRGGTPPRRSSSN